MRSTTLLAVVAGGVTAVNAVAQGFNYGSTQTDGSIKDQAAFESEFKTAKGLVGTSGFTSARLYTMIQGGTQNTPITAIPAAIAQQTNLLLGLWASGGQAGFDNEIAALKSAIESYGTAFTSLVNGISVGSEDLYRDSELGQLAKAGYGVGPDVVVSYIKQLRAALVGTPLSGASIGHVDTFNLWTNSSNKAVIDNVDWLGMDAYPYFQNTQANSIENAAALFSEAYAETTAVAGGKPVIITESGWPVSGPNQGQAVASLANAKTYWDQVGCPRFGKVDTYWFTLQDAYPVTPSPSFGIVGSTLSTTPLYDLSCSAVSSSSSASASSSTSASAASSIASSAASVAASSLATGGSGLSPTQGNGVGSSVLSIATSATSSSAAGSGTATATVIASSAAGSSSGNGTSIVATGTRAGSSVPTTVATSTQTGGAGSGGSSTTTSAQSTFTGAAAAVSGSMLGAVGAIFAMVAAL